ncbi:hypothetical protein SAMN05192548_104816 [Paraburkholderia terricola]|uniref:Uncharacterized protein n=1 Tax=Paraburkholderia terricola TaxID=169427 RepID=A0A1M6WQ17_9BURK|nr:hypothetical protein SAMN05192547_104236 [Paraburkholderia sediminicola]SHK95862.1 hypothetical protein SAMN05192548_104816 [Paraburkholderia terricola]
MNRRFRLHNPPTLETKKRSRVSLPCAARQDPSRRCVGARVRQVPREQRWPLSGARLRTEPGKRSQDRAKAWRPISNRTDDYYPDSLCSIHRISSSQSAAALALDPLPMYHFVWKRRTVEPDRGFRVPRRVLALPRGAGLAGLMYPRSKVATLSVTGMEENSGSAYVGRRGSDVCEVRSNVSGPPKAYGDILAAPGLARLGGPRRLVRDAHGMRSSMSRRGDRWDV